jgi:transcriptional regulator with XRE-family HTH domain
MPGVEVELPAELELPTCEVCLDYSVPKSMAPAVAEAVRERLAEWQGPHVSNQVNALCRRHHVSRRRVAAALGVTASYLSNIAAGDKLASLTLLRLLRAFVAVPAEFTAALNGEPLNVQDRFHVFTIPQPELHAWVRTGTLRASVKVAPRLPTRLVH